MVISQGKSISLEQALQTFFPDQDISVPITLLSRLVTEADRIELVEGTALSAVFRVHLCTEYPVLADTVDYIKLRERTANDKEAYYLQCARFMPVLEPIIPYYQGMVFSGEYSAILTRGTENKDSGVLRRRNEHIYEVLQNSILSAYAKATQQQLDKVFANSQLIDMFNIALLHTCMYDLVDSEPFTAPSSHPLMFSFDELEERAATTKNREDFIAFQGLRQRYERASEALDQLPVCKQGITVVHFDPRPENIFPSTKYRPIGDPEFACVNLPEYDLARLLNWDVRENTKAYIFLRNKLEVTRRGKHVFDINAGVIVERVHHLQKISLIRTYSALLGRNDPAARGYEVLLKLNFT